MAYRLDFSETPETSLHRCATERIEDAIAQLDTEREDDLQVAVHEARKDVKKTRALLRLHRSDLGDATYRRENRALRDAGRALSLMRDADVLLDTIDGLAERYAGQVPAGAFAALRERLGDDGMPAAFDEEVRALIARRRLDLQSEAGRVGQRVYAESPERFAARVGRYLRSAVRDTRAELVV